MTPKEVALLAAKALDDKKGQSIKLLKVADVTTLADYFLICTGTSNTHVKTLCDEVEKVLEEHGEAMLRREGQLQLGPDQFFRFETEGWVTNFFDGTK